MGGTVNANTAMLDEFLEGYHQWSRNGKGLIHASRELRYYLSQRRDRLISRGLEVEEEYEHVDQEIKGSLLKTGDPYYANLLYREGMKRMVFKKDGRVLKEFKEPITVYATLVNKKGFEDEACVCPNCGHESMISAVQEGCPYCGTFFETEDVYPCVTSSYTVNGITERAGLMDRIKRRMIIGGSIAAVIAFAARFIVATDYSIALRILSSLFVSAFCAGAIALVIYFACSIMLLGRVVREAGRALPLVSGMGTKKKLEERLKQSDPGFSFEYFEGRIISLLRTIAFSDNREALSIYTGKDDLSFLDDLVDMQYRGAIQLKGISEKAGVTEIAMKAFMTDIYAGSHIRKKDENFYLKVQRETGALTDPGFSLLAIECEGCGGSFDALHQKKCPYCGRAYDPVHEDWVISRISSRAKMEP